CQRPCSTRNHGCEREHRQQPDGGQHDQAHPDPAQQPAPPGIRHVRLLDRRGAARYSPNPTPCSTRSPKSVAQPMDSTGTRSSSPCMRSSSSMTSGNGRIPYVGMPAARSTAPSVAPVDMNGSTVTSGAIVVAADSMDRYSSVVTGETGGASTGS